MIEEYHFGLIKIDGRTFDHDVEVRWDGQVLKWWRKESHLIDFEDVKRAIEQAPQIIVIGTGAYGVAKITERARKEIEKAGIELIIDSTEEAVKTFNIILRESKKETGKPKRVVGLFHLTC